MTRSRTSAHRSSHLKRRAAAYRAGIEGLEPRRLFSVDFPTAGGDVGITATDEQPGQPVIDVPLEAGGDATDKQPTDATGKQPTDEPVSTTSLDNSDEGEIRTLGGDIRTLGGEIFANTTATTNPLLRGRTLTVRGTTAADTITIGLEGSNIAVTLNGTKTTYAVSAVRTLRVLADAGNDNVTVNLTPAAAAKLAITLDGAVGDDTLTTNVKASLLGGAGNDTLTGSTANDRLVGGLGDDTILSNGGRDSITAGLGRNRVTYANGDRDVGDLRLRKDSRGLLRIFGTARNDKFTFSKGNGNVVNVQLNDLALNQLASFDLTQVTGIRVEGSAGRDEVVAPANTFGTKPFSKKSIEVG
jgi:Ca2+-binding RTX toxin-like protein